MEGRILGNRYELLEKIGGGGMAHVYKAKCSLLNRYVAVKILRDEFINDEDFVKRFRIEAQSAASLSHPNIVSIYDVGHEGNIHYIVMEYVDGITLKDYINRETTLEWKDAVNIAIQICSAIDHAHKNHIIHRDIKPHNILLTKEGVAKVTDFGIARAVTSSTITMVGSTIGSVHYFSPEQARGGYIDEKSDLYSLGIGLFEMVTGRLPFDGESPVAVAIKHIQEVPDQPVNIKSDIPKGVNDIIMKAIQKDQNLRYQKASDMLQDMYSVLRDPSGGFIQTDNVEDFPTQRIDVIGDDILMKTNKKTNKNGNKKAVKGDRLTVWSAVVLSLVIIALLAYLGFRVLIPSIPGENTTFTVKSYVGRHIDDVEKELIKEDVTIKKIPKYDDNEPKGIITHQYPKEGNTLKRGGYSIVELHVSEGPEVVRIPDLRGKQSREAETELRNMGLEPDVSEVYSDMVPTGLVIDTYPLLEEEVKAGSKVEVRISMGPQKKVTLVPSIVGLTRIEADKKLSDAGLRVGKVYPEDSNNFIDIIEKQEPLPGGEVSVDTPVNIYLKDNNQQTTDINSGGSSQNGSSNQDGNNSQSGSTEQTGGSTDNETAVNQTEAARPLRVEKKVNISLINPADYSDNVQVVIDIKPSDTNVIERLMNEVRQKGDFPLSVKVPVPKNGRTEITYYFNNELINTITVNDGGAN